ncbi:MULTISPECIES: sialic acid TRAP transporter substrate-binding protein SiaP [Chelatococcus]|uniref:Tripartite ATP-independent transporter DctP family solute receptor n=1 Tax=Chelatococcus caeni TaxID=1348468 RepID=A0A840BW03_9HYPH|nr:MULTISPECIES: sialic acid TRAP transporter substrate-binding protein SiaP [Chelatococcus]ALA17420.1 C4-dicarboxylate ABC transporter [Chelatococcus sp. CO-6]MBB4016753.1 tripartite ATP-independent transporter DctP family solute receptor [Chelatococcus caeni]
MAFSLSRRLVLGLALSCPLIAGPALAADPVKLRISTPAVEADWHAKMLPVFKEELEKRAPGQFDVEIHLNATLFKQGTEPAAMQRGNLEMAMISAFDIAKQIPEWSIFTAGYLIRDPEHQQKVFASDIGEEMYKLVEDKMGIKVLSVGYLGTRQLNLRIEKEVKTPADLAGVKLRMPGSDTWLFLGKALGANPLPLAFGEIYTALQTGAIDGQDNPLPTVRAAKFYEVTKQIVLTDHLVDSIFLSLAGATWNKLDDKQKEAVLEAAKAAVAFNNEGRIGEERQLAADFAQQGLKVYRPDVEAFRTHVQKAYLESEFSKTWPKGMVERINAVK